MAFELPPALYHRISDLHGRAGQDWMARLPETLAACARRWDLAIGAPFTPLSYHYVTAVVRSGGEHAVLKLGFPGVALTREIAALAHGRGWGMVRLLAADAGPGALLLERLLPGCPLSEVADDRQATEIAAEVMRRIWRPLPTDTSFPPVVDWAAGFARLRDRFGTGGGPFPENLVSMAERLYTDLSDSMERPMLLHGDLHHGNILAAQRHPWLAIDPKGVAGEPAFEVGALLRNPLPQLLTGPSPANILADRVDQFADLLSLDRRRILAWGMSQAVLASWWAFEDHGRGWEPLLTCAEILAKLSPGL